MNKILLSAFSCNPYKGSESANGWNWSTGVVKEGFEVHTLTRSTNRKDIERHPKINNLHFHFLSLPFGLEKLYSISQPTMYLYYILWQWKAYTYAKKLSKIKTFHRVHHISWGSIQQGSFLYKLGVPFIYGPSGGGQKAPVAFKTYFGEHWVDEIKREKVSLLLVKFNPAFTGMIKNAAVVMVSNKDTEQLVKSNGAKNIFFTLDAALPLSFFPEKYIVRRPSINNLKLLWVGRFMPRKGLTVVLEVMKKLKAYKGISLTVVGDGEMREDAEEKCKEWGLENTVKFIGTIPLEEVRNYYRNHDVFLFTSLRDSCPAQLIEAMAFNLPVVTLDLHGQGQIINSETGIKVPVTEPEEVVEELANAVIKIAESPEVYESMSRAAYVFSRKQVWVVKIKDVITRFYN